MGEFSGQNLYEGWSYLNEDVDSIKVKGEFKWEALDSAKSVNKKTDFDIIIKTTKAGKFKGLHVSPSDKKYSEWLGIGRLMFKEFTKKQAIPFLKSGFINNVFMMPNNDFNRQKGTVGTLKFHFNVKDLEVIKQTIESLG